VPATFVVLMAGLTALGYWLVRRAILSPPPPPRIVSVAAPPATPAEAARAELDRIASSGLASSDSAEYYARIAATVRAYLSRSFGFPAHALTRSEIEHGMTGAGIDRWPARLTANLLEQATAAEYALSLPAPERMQQDLDAAYEIIALTEPAANTAPDAGAPKFA
jgi:hypothetical protein